MTALVFHRLPITSKLSLAVISAALLFSGAAQAADDAALRLSQASTKKGGGGDSKLSSRLSAQYEGYKKQQLRDQTTSSATPVDGDTVVIDAVAAGEVEDLIRDLKDLGATNISPFGRVVSAILALNAIPQL